MGKIIDLERLQRYHGKEKARTDAAYVAKEAGKGLSANDFTNAYKNKLDAMQSVMQLKGRVDAVANLPAANNQNGDVYLVGAAAATDFVEYIWTGAKWEKLGEKVTQITSYNALADKPQIGGVELTGNKTAAQLGLVSTADIQFVSDGEIDAMFNKP